MTCFGCKALPTNKLDSFAYVFAQTTRVKQQTNNGSHAQQLGITCSEKFLESFRIIKGKDN